VPLYLGATLLLRAWTSADLALLDKLTQRVPRLRGMPQQLQRWVRTA
jgi:hypothetical protein